MISDAELNTYRVLPHRHSLHFHTRVHECKQLLLTWKVQRFGLAL